MNNISIQIRKTLTVSAISFALAQGAFAATVSFEQIDGYYEESASTAGEITALGTPFLGGYNNSATVMHNGQTGYQTFCLEMNVDLQLSTEFDYTLASATGNANSLSLGSAWLYSEFAAGSLADYNYTPGSGREMSSTHLQEAFWWLEDQMMMSNPNDNIFLSAAFSQFGSQMAAKADASAGAYNVWVMNPSDNGSPVQSTMVVKIPDGGLTLGLLGLSLLGIARLRKHFSTVG